MYTGKFITIEGCEGCGKTTQIEMLKEYCAVKGIDALFTREPGGTAIAEKIRNVILDTANMGMESLTELFLFSASRVEHIVNVVLPALKAGKTVFCDRFTDSTLAYQVYGRELLEEAVKKINAISTNSLIIDCTIFLDVEPSEGFSRIATRGEADRMERMGIDFHKKVYNGFLDIAKKEPKRIAKISGKQSKEKVHNDIIATLKQRGIMQ